jgi:membrane dipeptidase
MGMENGAPIEDDLENIGYFFDQGIRYVTLTHSENNLICDSSYALERRWNGLSPFGREVVAEMNRVGVMIDISHVSDDAFYQVVELTTAPVIASHSSCRKFTPGFERNMDDDMIRALAENGGVIQINFGSAFLREDANRHSDEHFGALGAFAEENGLEEGDPAIEAFDEEYLAEHPAIFADIGDVVAHIDHVVDLAGVDHVGIGSDFDGVGDSLPTGLKDVSHFPNLIYELLKRGYSDEDVRKILGGNLIRVWSEVERVAAETAS